MNYIKSKKGTLLTVLSGAVTAAICLVMNLILIPKIEAAAQGLRCFDMNFGYTYEDAVRFLSSISGQGRYIYLHFQLPLDFIYPIAYAAFFILLTAKLTQRLMPLCLLPAVLMLFDYTENICILLMLRSAPSERFAAFASAATSIKTILMYAVFAEIIVSLIYFFGKRRNR